MSARALGLVPVLVVLACGSKAEPAVPQSGGADANAGVAASPEPAAKTDPYRFDAPEAALTAYVEAKRRRDAEVLWALMPSDARPFVERALERARQQPPAEIAQTGLTPSELAGLSAHDFFVQLVKVMPAKDAAMLTEAPRDVVARMDGDAHAWLTYKVATHDCRGEAKKEADGWKVRGARCGEPEPTVAPPSPPPPAPGTTP